ncbi:MAG: hypothetical protein HND52_16325 [Ignavibacteriae bacterium]|nr:hypothetical protein [Ignavibacteriota bacterium]NOG99524.1 hypothetical protein [Ignavibacteriota bacterium]
MKINLKELISPIKLTGTRHFITVDLIDNEYLLSLILIPKGLINSKSNEGISSYKVLETQKIPVSSKKANIKEIIDNFLTNYNLRKAPVLLGLDQYKIYSISLPSDTEDVELWFLENSSSFLPPKSNRNEFEYRYFKYFENEEVKKFLVVVTRNENIERITNQFTIPGLELVSVFPFLLSSIFLSSENIHLKINENELTWIVKNSNKELLFGEFYFDNSHTQNPQKNYELEFSALSEIAGYIRRNIFNGFKTLEESVCKIYMSHPFSNQNEVDDLLKSEFQSNLQCKKIIQSHKANTSLLAVNSIVTHSHDELNFLEEKLKIEFSNSTDRTIFQRIVLSCGVVFMILLIMLNGLEQYFLSQSEENHNRLQLIRANERKIDKLENDISQLEKDYSKLFEIKYNNQNYSEIFSSIANCTSRNTKLVQLSIKCDSSKSFLSVKGKCNSQNDIVNFIDLMEDYKIFFKPQLEYSQRNKGKYKIKVIDNKIDFKINSKFDVSKKY